MVTTDEYTPTTGEVRVGFARQYPDLPADPDDMAAFDRWLAARDAEVAERIAQALGARSFSGERASTRVTIGQARHEAARIAREAGRA